MAFQTEFQFTLPKGYVDKDGKVTSLTVKSLNGGFGNKGGNGKRTSSRDGNGKRKDRGNGNGDSDDADSEA